VEPLDNRSKHSAICSFFDRLVISHNRERQTGSLAIQHRRHFSLTSPKSTTILQPIPKTPTTGHMDEKERKGKERKEKKQPINQSLPETTIPQVGCIR